MATSSGLLHANSHGDGMYVHVLAP